MEADETLNWLQEKEAAQVVQDTSMLDYDLADMKGIMVGDS